MESQGDIAQARQWPFCRSKVGGGIKAMVHLLPAGPDLIISVRRHHFYDTKLHGLAKHFKITKKAPTSNYETSDSHEDAGC